MPELPEVETIKRGLEHNLLNQTIATIQLHRSNLRKPIPLLLQTDLKNIKIIQITRRGKYILMKLSNDHTVVFHLGMSGKIIVRPLTSNYQRNKHEHITLITKKKQCLSYVDPRRFGFVDYLNNDQIDLYFNKMGPEPLPDPIHNNEQEYQKKLADHLYLSTRNKKQSIKNILLDQQIIAGLGNIYVCETLHIAKISPIRTGKSLTKKEFMELVKGINIILSSAIVAGGSSMRDYVHSDGKKGYFQMQWQVYGKENVFCQNCFKNEKKVLISKINQAGRSTFYCQSCQQ